MCGQNDFFRRCLIPGKDQIRELDLSDRRHASKRILHPEISHTSCTRAWTHLLDMPLKLPKHFLDILPHRSTAAAISALLPHTPWGLTCSATRPDEESAAAPGAPPQSLATDRAASVPRAGGGRLRWNAMYVRLPTRRGGAGERTWWPETVASRDAGETHSLMNAD